jgi:REP element-mobilizing transposase RayT
MPYDPSKHHRRSIRLQGYDYRQAGIYHVTICSFEKRCVFGKIEEDQFIPNAYGRIVMDCWLNIENHTPFPTLDEWQLMPNHLHGLLVLSAEKIAGESPAEPQFQVPAGSLGVVVRSFKAAVKRQVNKLRSERELAPVEVWQSNYYEHIVRDEDDLNRIRRYIIENPLNWDLDENRA